MDAYYLSRSPGAEMVKRPSGARLLLGVALLALLAGVVALSYRGWQTFGALSVHKAAERGDIVALRAALQRHPDQLDATASFKVDKRRSMMPPLMWAVRGGNLQAIQLLIERGANVNAKDEFGTTALWLAVDGKSGQIADLLLHANADPNAVTTFGSSSLVCAVRRGDIPMATKLLDAGANPNAPLLKSTPLFEAVEAGQVESLRLLLDRGAKIDDQHEIPMMLNVAKRLPYEKASAIEELLRKLEP